MKIVAYTDGSFMQGTKGEQITGFGVVTLIDDDEFPILGTSTDKNLLESRNVSGELLGVIELIKMVKEGCLDSNGVPNYNDVELHIYYDYEGVEKWITGEWRAKKALTQHYRDEVRSALNDGLKVNWHKVRAHTGIALNERADALAKKAIQDYAKEHNIELC